MAQIPEVLGDYRRVAFSDTINGDHALQSEGVLAPAYASRRADRVRDFARSGMHHDCFANEERLDPSTANNLARLLVTGANLVAGFSPIP